MFRRPLFPYAGLDVPQTMQGRSLRPLIEDPEAAWRDEIFLESLFLYVRDRLSRQSRTKDWEVRSLLSQRYVTVHCEDVDFRRESAGFRASCSIWVNDPAEERNLIEDASQAAGIAAFRERSRQYSVELVQASKDMKKYPR